MDVFCHWPNAPTIRASTLWSIALIADLWGHKSQREHLAKLYAESQYLIVVHNGHTSEPTQYMKDAMNCFTARRDAARGLRPESDSELIRFSGIESATDLRELPILMIQHPQSGDGESIESCQQWMRQHFGLTVQSGCIHLPSDSGRHLVEVSGNWAFTKIFGRV